MAGRDELLKSHYLFKDLAPSSIERIAALGVTRTLGANQPLFSKGDEGDALYGVLHGRIRISAVAPSGKEVILNVINPGEIFAEIALLDGGPRTADASAMEATELLQIHRRDFLQFLESEPRVASHLLKLVCDRMRVMNEMLEDSAFLSLPSRLAKRVLNLSRHQSEERDPSQPLQFKISQSELGQMMGVSRESINKYLQAWRRAGWIELSRGKITLLNVPALENFIEEDAFE